MAEKDVMVHPSMDEMANAFKAAAQTLDGTLQALQKQAQSMQGGSLLGTGGQAFVELLNGVAKKKVTDMKEAMTKFEGEIKKAQQRNRQAESSAKSDVQQ